MPCARTRLLEVRPRPAGAGTIRAAGGGGARGSTSNACTVVVSSGAPGSGATDTNASRGCGGRTTVESVGVDSERSLSLSRLRKEDFRGAGASSTPRWANAWPGTRRRASVKCFIASSSRRCMRRVQPQRECASAACTTQCAGKRGWGEEGREREGSHEEQPTLPYQRIWQLQPHYHSAGVLLLCEPPQLVRVRAHNARPCMQWLRTCGARFVAASSPHTWMDLANASRASE